MKIAIGCDHIVTPIKDQIKEYLISKGHKVFDCGTYNKIKTHYPLYGYEVGRLVANKKVDCGVVMCGTGVGITNSCNKVKGVRCALVRDLATAKAAKREWNANVIGFGGMISGVDSIKRMVDGFLNEKYNGSHQHCIEMIDNAIPQDNSKNIKMFDNICKDWENGKYTKKTKQQKVPRPKTWKEFSKI